MQVVKTIPHARLDCITITHQPPSNFIPHQFPLNSSDPLSFTRLALLYTIITPTYTKKKKRMWKEQYLDLILVPLGFSIMCIYHLFLLYRYLTCPEATSIGYENHNKKAWVEKMLLLDGKDRGFAVAVLNGHLSASTSLSSISLVLCSLIGALLGNSSTNFLNSPFILGDTSRSTSTIKYIAMLSCFLLAFACFVQTTRHFVHGSFLISMPAGDVPVDCIQKAVLRGSNFWNIGLRALYFATTLLLWIFGPIPMVVGSIAAVMILYFLDINKDPMIEYSHNRNGHGDGLLKKFEHGIEAFQHNGRQ